MYALGDDADVGQGSRGATFSADQRAVDVSLNRIVVEIGPAEDRLAALAFGNRGELGHHLVAIDVAHDVAIARADPGDRNLAIAEVELPRQIADHANAGDGLNVSYLGGKDRRRVGWLAGGQERAILVDLARTGQREIRGAVLQELAARVEQLDGELLMRARLQQHFGRDDLHRGRLIVAAGRRFWRQLRSRRGGRLGVGAAEAIQSSAGRQINAAVRDDRRAGDFILR